LLGRVWPLLLLSPGHRHHLYKALHLVPIMNSLPDRERCACVVYCLHRLI